MVSVIIPTFNRDKTIERAIQSVLNQTYNNLELIIVDDCSTDDTFNIIKKINDPRLKYIRHAYNQGACAARNTGIENAIGEYIAFQDSDDFWSQDKLQLQMKFMVTSNADICFCNLCRHGFSSHTKKIYPDLENGEVPYEQLIMRPLASTQTIVTKEIIAKQNKFDPEVNRLQDYDWIIRAGENRKTVFVKEALVDVYLQDDSLTNTSAEKLLNTYELFLKKYAYLFEKYPQFHAKMVEQVGYFKTMIGENASSEYKEAFKINENWKLFVKWKLSQLKLLKFFIK